MRLALPDTANSTSLVQLAHEVASQLFITPFMPSGRNLDENGTNLKIFFFWQLTF